MTSLAFILGVTPLAVSSGAGAASRHSIGTGVIGGMLLATFIATFFMPLFYSRIAGVASASHAAEAASRRRASEMAARRVRPCVDRAPACWRVMSPAC